MNNKRATKRALLTSVMALAMCVVMLVGTTFAWFTDTASTAVNKIQAGNLDVKLMYSTDMQTWTEATEQTKLFDDNALWEPGYTQVVYLKVVNAGNLALKYEVSTNSYDMERGKNAAGELFYIDKFLRIGTATTENAFNGRSDAIAAIAGSEKNMGKEMQISDDWAVLDPKAESKPFAVVIYMPTTVGNEANNVQSWRHPSLKGFGLVVNATQATMESDSFDNTYDEKAATVLAAESASYGTHEITQNMQANGRYGAVQAEKTAQFTINADVYAVYTKDTSGTTGGAMAVQADGNSKVIINGGDFRQVGVPADDPVCDLIYALGNATIEINGGTFKAVTPANTLNCKDGANAKITVKGGSFYKYDPSNPTLGDNEVVVAAGYHVVQNGDWYKVVAD
jgi:predicted ribosomally synthesized peptide with SipW-like signal peptide